MRLPFASLLLIVSSFLFYSCGSAPSKLVVAKFGDHEISLDEFQEAYSKSSGEVGKTAADSAESIKDFLELYVNYKMKLRDASVRGYDTDPDVINEIENYKKQIGKSYIFERELTEPGVRRLYERRKYEFRVSHLMIGTDSLTIEEAEKRAEELIKRITNGENFEELVKLYSTDPRTKNSGGDLYYMTAGEFLPEFEDAIYNTPVGKVYEKPLQSRIGFHIIKVTEKRERIPRIRVRHILASIAKDKETGIMDTVTPFNKINNALREIESGADFAEVAKKYSDDKNSAVNGGDIGFFERKKTAHQFDEASFNLDVGEISGIIRTVYGYHIIQLIEKEKYPAYEAENEKLKNLYSKNFYRSDYKEYVEQLKNEFNLIINNDGLEFIMSQTDSTILDNDYWNSDFRNSVKGIKIFSIKDESYTFDSLMNKFMIERKLNNKLLTSLLLNTLVDSYSEEILFDLKSEELDKIDPKFAMLMDDYKNGIMIFKLHEEEIWEKVKSDEASLREYFNKNRRDYKWNTRISFSEIMTKSDSLANAYYEMLQSGAKFDSLASIYTEREGFKEKAGFYDLMEIHETILSKKANEIINPGDYSEPFKLNDEWAILRLNWRVPAGLKSFEEARSEVATNFQEKESKRLEEEYINRLKQIYKPVIYNEVLKDIGK
ncbi:peptidylprolyl isomerase [Bacteroidota bacterium]